VGTAVGVGVITAVAVPVGDGVGTAVGVSMIMIAVDVLVGDAAGVAKIGVLAFPPQAKSSELATRSPMSSISKARFLPIWSDCTSGGKYAQVRVSSNTR